MGARKFVGWKQVQNRTWLGKISILTRFHLDAWRQNKINDAETYRGSGILYRPYSDQGVWHRYNRRFSVKNQWIEVNLSKEISRNILLFT